MKVIGSVKEDLSLEKRISITPETTKKFTELGFNDVALPPKGAHRSFQ